MQPGLVFKLQVGQYKQTGQLKQSHLCLVLCLLGIICMQHNFISVILAGLLHAQSSQMYQSTGCVPDLLLVTSQNVWTKNKMEMESSQTQKT